MLKVLRLYVFALTAFMLSCADYPQLDLSVKKGDGITDKRNNKTYRTVIIGYQEWMAENLNYSGEDKDTIIGRCYNDSINCENNLGRLYTWAEAMKLDSSFNYRFISYVSEPYRGICPEGSHLPSSEEWNALFDYIGWHNNGLKLKTAKGWAKNNGTDEYGFAAMPGGCHYNGEFTRIGICGAWWSTTEANLSKEAVGVEICNDDTQTSSFIKASWASIRCIKDE